MVESGRAVEDFLRYRYRLYQHRPSLINRQLYQALLPLAQTHVRRYLEALFEIITDLDVIRRSTPGQRFSYANGWHLSQIVYQMHPDEHACWRFLQLQLSPGPVPA